MKLEIIDRKQIRKAAAYDTIIRQALRLPMSKAGRLRRMSAEQYNAIKYQMKKMEVCDRLTCTKEGDTLVFMRLRKPRKDKGGSHAKPAPKHQPAAHAGAEQK